MSAICGNCGANVSQRQAHTASCPSRPFHVCDRCHGDGVHSWGEGISECSACGGTGFAPLSSANGGSND
jgi:ribosomal protein L37AE/L43A